MSVLVAIVVLVAAGVFARANRPWRIAASVAAPCAIGLALLVEWAAPEQRAAFRLWYAAEVGPYFPGGLSVPIALTGLAAWAGVRMTGQIARRLAASRYGIRRLPRRGAGPVPAGVSGWLAVVVAYTASMQVVALADVVVYALAEVDPPTVSPLVRGVSGLAVPGIAYALASAVAWIVSTALWFAHLRALVMRRPSFVPWTTALLAVLIVSSLGLFAFEVALLGSEVATNVQVIYLLGVNLPFAVAALCYIGMSRRVRATFAAQRPTAATGRHVPDAGARERCTAAALPPLVVLTLIYWVGLAVVYGVLDSTALTAWTAAYFGALLGFGILAMRSIGLQLRRRGTGRAAAVATVTILLYGASQVGEANLLDWQDRARAVPAPDRTVVDVRGPVSMGMLDAVAEAIRSNPGIRILDIRSDGGITGAAARIGGLIVRHGLSVRAMGDCASACTDIFLSARVRELGPSGRLGFHGSPLFLWLYVNVGVDLPYVDRLRRAGASQAFVARVQATPASEMWYPSLEEVLRNGMATGFVRDAPFGIEIAHGRDRRATGVAIQGSGGGAPEALALDPLDSHPTYVLVDVPRSGTFDLRIRFSETTCLARGIEITPLRREIVLPPDALACAP